MPIALITGSLGLVGSETSCYLAGEGFEIVGVDNDMRKYFFGDAASTAWNKEVLVTKIDRYTHHDTDIRDAQKVSDLFAHYGSDIALVIHAAAQPSHDWAAQEPFTDFSVNATGTLNLLEATRLHAPEAVFIFTSTNKVYGDRPNSLPLVEMETRWEIEKSHPYFARGIDESMSIDATLHSLFGASKVAADVMTQEYGRYFGMKTGCFRGGCLTGPAHSGAKLHGFLAYLMKCAVTGDPYTIFGYKGKQVRDNIHSRDLAAAFHAFAKNPRPGQVYNIGGGRFSNCSMQEAITFCEQITGKKMIVGYDDRNRIGDHIWWVSDTSKFATHYPDWRQEYDIEKILVDIHDNMRR
jgi:CDP-paratose 2-epimerase